MSQEKKAIYEHQARAILSGLKKRRMTGCYCADSASACRAILSMLSPGMGIGWGGSQTMREMGLMEQLLAGDYRIFNRDTAKTQEEKDAVYAKIQTADVFFTSTNAITLDGELVNVDGRSDRISFLCFGPKRVIIPVGMNKVVDSVSAGMARIRLLAGPMNAAKNGKRTPCAVNGLCTDCFAEDSICSNTLVTRRSSIKDRIHIVLIGEELGY